MQKDGSRKLSSLLPASPGVKMSAGLRTGAPDTPVGKYNHNENFLLSTPPLSETELPPGSEARFDVMMAHDSAMAGAEQYIGGAIVVRGQAGGLSIKTFQFALAATAGKFVGIRMTLSEGAGDCSSASILLEAVHP